MPIIAKRFFGFLFCLCLTVSIAANAGAGDTVFQYSTIDALLAGLFDGKMTLKDLKYHGDFGLGTLNGIDGELVLLDGTAYHVAAGGKANIPDDSSEIPFATAAFFEEDSILKLDRIASLEALNETVDQSLPSKNIFYAIRIDGRFSYVKARAIPKQNEPYEPLAKVAKQQVVVQFTGEGTLVGFYSPSFAKGVNVPGFHWHFLTKDRSGGGHVLDCSFAPTTARLNSLHTFSVQLPDSKRYDALDLSGDKSEELNAVEKDPAKKK